MLTGICTRSVPTKYDSASITTRRPRGIDREHLHPAERTVVGEVQVLRHGRGGRPPLWVRRVRQEEGRRGALQACRWTACGRHLQAGAREAGRVTAFQELRHQLVDGEGQELEA